MRTNLLIKITTPPGIFADKAKRAMADELNSVLPGWAYEIQRILRQNVPEMFKLSPTYTNLLTGHLRGHFGIIEGTEQAILDKMLDILRNEIFVTHQKITVKRSGEFGGGLEVYMFKASFEDLLKMPEGYIVNEDGSDVDPLERLHWMKWMLVDGDHFKIWTHHIVFGDYGGRVNLHGESVSRSGIATMFRGGEWTPPLSGRGTLKNNWITRAVTRGFYIIKFALEQAFYKILLRFT